jgi:c(7)-type cytochrome triheme protein
MALFLLSLLSALFLSACENIPTATQPIQFSHKAHTEKGLPCALCHQFVEKASFAGIPTTATCLMCHRGAITQNPEEEKVRQYAKQGLEIPWQRLYRVPGHVYFSHRRHVALGRIPCAQCHGAVEESRNPPPRPVVTLDMGECMACHVQKKVSNDCNACHR